MTTRRTPTCRSDCGAAPVDRIVAVSQSGRRWVLDTCAEHYDEHRAIPDALGFTVVGLTDPEQVTA